MKVRDLILAMHREERLNAEGYCCFTGHLDTVCEDVKDNTRDYFSEAITYRKAMDYLIVAARKHNEARLFLLRLEQKPVPVALQFDKATACLLREDPVAFLRMMDPAMGQPQKLDVSMRVRKERTTAIKPHPIPSGYDTLAEAFGDDVYIRRKVVAGSVVYESPITGRWVPVTELGAWAADVNNKWAVVPVINLLHFADVEEFFIPRAWNKEGPWISASSLRNKYDKFVTERERCSRIHKADTSES